MTDQDRSDPTLQRLRAANPVRVSMATTVTRSHPAADPTTLLAPDETAPRSPFGPGPGPGPLVPRLVAVAIVVLVGVIAALVVGLTRDRTATDPAPTQAGRGVAVTMHLEGGPQARVAYVDGTAHLRLPMFEAFVGQADGLPAAERRALGLETVEYDEAIVVGERMWLHARPADAPDRDVRWYEVSPSRRSQLHDYLTGAGTADPFHPGV